MKKKILVALFLFAFVSISNAQFLWYENETNTYKIQKQSTTSGTFFTDVTNPDNTGINTNATVSKFNRNLATSSNVSFNLGTSITSLSGFSINLKAYIRLASGVLQNPNTRIRVYLANSSVNEEIYVQKHFSVDQTWELKVFDFSGEVMSQAVVNAGGFDKIRISFADSNNNVNAATYYIDSIYGTTEQLIDYTPASLAGSWGARLYVRAGGDLDDYVNNGYDYVAGAQEMISSYPSMGHVMTNATNNANSQLWTLRTNENVDAKMGASGSIIDEEFVPSLANEQVIIDVINVFKNANKKVFLYLNGMSPADRATSTGAAAWTNYVNTYFAGDVHKAWMDYCEGYIKRFKLLGVDGYWIDAFNSYPGNDTEREEFIEMIRNVDPNILITANYDKDYFTDNNGDFIIVDSDGVDDVDETDYKVIKMTAVNYWSDFTAGHITPLGQGAPPNSWAYEEFTVPDMQASPTSVYDNSKKSLKHLFLPIRETWSSERSDLMFNNEQAYRFVKKITDAGASVTFSTTTDTDGTTMEDEESILRFVDQQLRANAAVTPYVRPEGAYLVGELPATPIAVYHAADDSVFLSLKAESNLTYTTSVANPDMAGNTHTNVSSMLPSANNGSVDFILTHPFKPNGTNKINFSFNYYTATNGGNGSGSGQYTVRLYNSVLTDQVGDRVDIIGENNRIGGSWQTEKSVFGITLATDPEVIANGGYDRLKIIFNNYITAEAFYIDNITFDTKDDTSDLATGNSWLYNYSPDAFNAVTNNVGGGSSHAHKASDVPTEANSSTTVLEVKKGTTGTSGVNFKTGDFDYTTSTLTFRVYPVSSTITPVDPKVSVILRKEGTNNSDFQKSTAIKTIAPDKWNEVTFTFADLTSASTPTDNLYDQILLVFNAGTIDSGATYYVDAVQNATSTLNWVGTTNSDWATANNWGNAIVPNDSYNVKIHQTTVSDGTISTFPTISTAVTVNNLSLTSPASLVFTGGGSLTATENVTYNRAIDADKWYYMSSPVIGESFDDAWITANGIASGTGNNRAISIFDNTSLDTATGYWRYFQAGDAATPFNVAQGYSIRRSSGSAVSFTGSGFYATSQTTSISRGLSNYSLISNPFTAYLNLGDFFADNTAENLLGKENIYVWDADNQFYETKTSLIDGAYELAHGQGFFVEAGTVGGTITFDIADVSHQGTDTFLKSSNASKENSNTFASIKLLIEDENSISRNARFYFIEGTTTGFDNGYDGELFGGATHTFALFSELVNNNDKKYQIQSLPITLIESAVISVGLIAEAGKTITFSAETIYLPTGLKVYLEDRQENTFTLLNEVNSKYEVTLDAKSNGVGRFFLHTSNKTLNIDSLESLNNISLYKTNMNTLKISGLPQGNTTVKLFNVLGKQVFNSSYAAKGINEITLPGLAKGVYIVQLETENGKLNKKIIL